MQSERMSHDRAKDVLRAATLNDDGTFTLLRLGFDPGVERVSELRLALRVLWRHWKNERALPFEITLPAAIVLHFSSECYANDLAKEHLLRDQVRDLGQDAFALLSGAAAEGEVIRRADLGE